MESSRVGTDGVAADRLWLWFAQPADEAATLLMVHARHPEGFTYLRPLIAGSLEQANRQAPFAEDAAAALGVAATLREYQLVAVEALEPARSAP